MAKKTTSRSNAEPKPDAVPAAAPAAKPRTRARAAKAQPQGEAPSALADDRATNVDEPNQAATSMSMSGMGDTPAEPNLPANTRTSSRADEAASTNGSANTNQSASMSMASEPSEDDIRIRAYHRYLERGGGHGMDFEDWLEAERDLRRHE